MYLIISHKINIILFLPIEICICHVGILQLEIDNISAAHVGRMLSRSVSGVTKVRYGDRPDFRTLEWGVPVCKVASIQIGRGFNLCVAPF